MLTRTSHISFSEGKKNTPAHVTITKCFSHLHLPLAHDLVYDLVVILVELGFVVAFLVAQDAQALRALQLDFKLLLDKRAHQINYKVLKKLQEITRWTKKKKDDLVPVRLVGVSEHAGLGFANKVTEGVHFECAIEI